MSLPAEGERGLRTDAHAALRYEPTQVGNAPQLFTRRRKLRRGASQDDRTATLGERARRKPRDSCALLATDGERRPPQLDGARCDLADARCDLGVGGGRPLEVKGLQPWTACRRWLDGEGRQRVGE